MSLSSLSSGDLGKLIELIKEKVLLQTRLTKVKDAIDALGSGSEVAVEKTVKTGHRRRRRVALKDAILKALENAGKEGTTVKELAVGLKANLGSVAVWFYTTGKKVKGLKKVGPGRYTYHP